METLDCGDHSCDFAKDKSGMRTNGGCRCLKPMSDAQRHKVKQHIKQLELQVGELRKWVQMYSECDCDTRRKPGQPHWFACRRALADKMLWPDGNVQRKVEPLVDQLEQSNRLNEELQKKFLYWTEGFAKHGFLLHPGLTPEQNAAEWKAKYEKALEWIRDNHGTHDPALCPICTRIDRTLAQKRIQPSQNEPSGRRPEPPDYSDTGNENASQR